MPDATRAACVLLRHRFQEKAATDRALQRAGALADDLRPADAARDMRSKWHAFVAARRRGENPPQLSSLAAEWQAMTPQEQEAAVAEQPRQVPVRAKPSNSCQPCYMPQSCTPLGIGDGNYPLCQEEAQKVVDNVFSLHRSWCQRTASVIHGPGVPDDGAEATCPQCVEQFEPGVCSSHLSDVQMTDYMCYKSQLANLVNVAPGVRRTSAKDHCGVLLFEILPPKEVFLLIAKHKTPKFPVFLDCSVSGAGVMCAGSLVEPKLDTPVHCRVHTAFSLAQAYMKALPPGTRLQIRHWTFEWEGLSGLRAIASEDVAASTTSRRKAPDPIAKLVNKTEKEKRKQADKAPQDSVMQLVESICRKQSRRKPRRARAPPAQPEDAHKLKITL